jgi:hypothetical protein
MKTGKEQHTIPYFYLNQFINPGWVYNLGSPQPKRVQSARSTAVREFYYSQNTDEEDYPLDSINTYIEGYAAPILRELLMSEDGLTGAKKWIFSHFISNLALRVPPYIEETGEAIINLMEQIDYKTKRTLEKLEKDGIKIEKDQPLIKYETGESDSFTWTRNGWEKELGSMREKSKAGKAMMKENMSIITDLAKVIAKMSWFIIDAPAEAFFITSDRPVYLTNRDASKLVTGWANHNAFGTLPLSPRRYLILSYLYPSDTWAYKQASIKEAEYLNARTVASAKYAIYSPEKYPPAENWLRKAVQEGR